MSDQPNQPEDIEPVPTGADSSESAGDDDLSTPGVGHGVQGESTGVSEEEVDLLRSAAGELQPEPEDTDDDSERFEPETASREDRNGASPSLPDFGGTPPHVDPKRVTMLNDVKLRVKIELGRSRMLVEDVLKLGEGSVVELDKLAGDPVDVYVNDRLVARGEVLVLNDNFCVRVSDVISNDPHRVST